MRGTVVATELGLVVVGALDQTASGATVRPLIRANPSACRRGQRFELVLVRGRQRMDTWTVPSSVSVQAPSGTMVRKWTSSRGEVLGDGLPSDDVTDVLASANVVWVVTRGGLARKLALARARAVSSSV